MKGNSMKNSYSEKNQVMSVTLPEFVPEFDGNIVVVSPDVLATVAQKAKILTKYAHSRLHGSSVSAEIQLDPLNAVTINIYAAPMAAYHARHPHAFGASVANFPSMFEQDHAALNILATAGDKEDFDVLLPRKDIVSRAILRKVFEDKDVEELSIKAGAECHVNIQTVKPTSTTYLNKDVEEITGSVRNVDSQDSRVRLFKMGNRQPNLTLYIKKKEDRERLLTAQLEDAKVTVKFRRLTNSMTSSHSPRHGVLVEIKD